LFVQHNTLASPIILNSEIERQPRGVVVTMQRLGAKIATAGSVHGPGVCRQLTNRRHVSNHTGCRFSCESRQPIGALCKDSLTSVTPPASSLLMICSRNIGPASRHKWVSPCLPGSNDELPEGARATASFKLAHGGSVAPLSGGRLLLLLDNTESFATFVSPRPCWIGAFS
jgi:hypothetical protein